MTKSKMNNYNLRMQQEKSPYRVISLLICLLSLVAVGTGYYLMSLYEYPGAFGITVLAAVFAIFLSILSYQLMTVKIRRDLKTHDYQVRKVVVLGVMEMQDVEPGSGAMYIPILGRIAPKLWGQRMRPVMRYILNANDGLSYPVTKEESRVKAGEEVNLFFGKRSGIFVGVEAAFS